MDQSPTTAAKEYSLILLKPDAVEQGICLHVLHRIVHDIKGRIRASKIFHFTDETLQKHYAHIAKEPFFPRIQQYMTRTEVWANVVEGGPDSIRHIRDIIGSTDPRKAKPGTIRHKFGKVSDDDVLNVVHASGSQDEALQEIKNLFTADEIRNAVPEIADRIFGPKA
ncbi:MAG: nucleoside-diphosphate kinase [Candidatus Peribacteraceae bacterium]|nr:nucleoside-diphosphate kinase [Candidatus Peribacteraceae bacterium]